MQQTHEQSPIVQSKASKILVRAFAGTGKTTTLIGFARVSPILRTLYLCYNSSVEKAVRGKSPRNVVCKTARSLVHVVYGIQYAHKKTRNLRLTDIAHGLNTQDWELVRDVLTTLNNYMTSANAELGRPRFPRFRDKTFLTSAQERFFEQGLDIARVVWRRMVDLQDTGILMPHDDYLKLYQLSKLDLGQCFDYMLLDEGQDINPVIVDIAHWQRIKMAIVSDPHQQPYRFRGTGDALNGDWMVGAEEHYLTQGWRFGPVIAHMANVILSYKGGTRRFQGLGLQMLVKESLPAGLPHRTFIHHTVIGVTGNTLQHMRNNPTPRFYWVGGIDSYSLRDLEDLYTFSRGLHQNVQNRKLPRDYRGYTQYVGIAEISQDSEVLHSIKIISTYPDLPARILELRSLTLDGELDTIITLTAVHKAKGLEWGFIYLYDDFNADPLAPGADPGEHDDELNLIYATVTRVMKVLAINSLMLSIMQRYMDEGKLEELAVNSRE